MFFTDADVADHPVEKFMGQWVSDFHGTLSQFAAGKVRFSELRPFYLH